MPAINVSLVKLENPPIQVMGCRNMAIRAIFHTVWSFVAMMVYGTFLYSMVFMVEIINLFFPMWSQSQKSDMIS